MLENTLQWLNNQQLTLDEALEPDITVLPIKGKLHEQIMAEKVDRMIDEAKERGKDGRLIIRSNY